MRKILVHCQEKLVFFRSLSRLVKTFTVRKYQKSDYALWNDFVSQSKNATFLFHRDFMEYHGDRFSEFSLLVFKDEKLLALLPGNRAEDVLHSHQGLSYGGVLVKNNIRIKEYTHVFATILNFLEASGITTLVVKGLPKIYNKTISEEIDHLSFLASAEVIRSDVYLAIDNAQKYKPNRNRKRALELAKGLNIVITETDNYKGFWDEVLNPNLQNRFGVAPVHSVAEIEKLAALFPDNIKLFTATQDGQLKAGVVLFLTETVAHFQYSSGTDDRKETASLDVLFDFIIRNYSDKKYISFGSASENNGRVLNQGLAYWKESFGALSSVQPFLKFETKNYHLIPD